MDSCLSKVRTADASPTVFEHEVLNFLVRHLSSAACALLSDSVLRGGDVEQDQFPLHFRVQVAVEHEPAAMLYHQTYD